MFNGFESAIARDEWKFIFLIRAMYFPEWLKNYGISIFNVRFRVFLVATFSVSLVYSAAFTYIGKSSEKLIEELHGGSGLSVLVIATAIGFAVYGIVWISSSVRRELDRTLAAPILVSPGVRV
jgi:uncharacterized membrane protein YdjX (TVP38/TMEM64 family)